MSDGNNIEVDRFVEKILGEMEDEGFSPQQKEDVLTILSERIFLETSSQSGLGEFGEEWVRMFPIPG
ncbi:MAG: hypothetical protein ACD_7C00506G0003 [uncultured bacterium]|nr:MAG: hypothetical protein ACD_7C00506G0003 [uncultured bacterium]HBR78921.1 hypothetical protein [Candidatus Moranbacteria bacterium]